jgi:hypothetical protein
MKQIIFWTNCQGSAIIRSLQNQYPNLYKVDSFLNYEYIKNNLQLPSMFKEADIFIYQNYSDKPGSIYDLTYVFNQLKQDCVKICIPFLQFDAIYSYNNDSPHNSKTIGNNLPFGKFFYGIDIIHNLVKDIEFANLSQTQIDIIIDNVYIKLISDDVISEETIKYYHDRSLEYLQNKILTSDVPQLYDYIQNNWKTTRLFHNRNHPTGILLNILVKCVFNKLGLEYTDNINFLESILSDWVMPVLPCVKKYYNINFDDICSSWYNSEIIDTKTFVKHYIQDLYINTY